MYIIKIEKSIPFDYLFNTKLSAQLAAKGNVANSFFFRLLKTSSSFWPNNNNFRVVEFQLL